MGNGINDRGPSLNHVGSFFGGPLRKVDAHNPVITWQKK